MKITQFNFSCDETKKKRGAQVLICQWNFYCNNWNFIAQIAFKKEKSKCGKI